MTRQKGDRPTLTLYTCHYCGGPAFGVFCSVRCWKLDRGELTSEEPTQWPDETIEAHANAPRIYASRPGQSQPPALPSEPESVELPPATAQEQSDWATWIDDEQKPVCLACGDTGQNSKGGPCIPCEKNGRVPSEPIPAPTPAELPPEVPRQAVDRRTGQQTPQLALF